MSRNLRDKLYRFLMPKGADGYTADIIRKGDCRTALDIGSGTSSHLSTFRPQILTMAIDASEEAMNLARANNAHDFYFVGDIMKESVESVLKHTNGEKFDLVPLYGVIEHFPKRIGFELLERCELLTKKYILLETPNGFFPQGPEFGNEFQRHLSGWFEHDFEGLGYRVYGTSGTKLFRGDGAAEQFDILGIDVPRIVCDVLASWLLRISQHPRRAFNLVAIKDVRGVPARMALRKGD